MKKTNFLCGLLFAFSAPPALVASASPAQDGLALEISALDATVFDAFNHCGEPGRLEEHAGYFSPDVEFYHDTGEWDFVLIFLVRSMDQYVEPSRELFFESGNVKSFNTLVVMNRVNTGSTEPVDMD